MAISLEAYKNKQDGNPLHAADWNTLMGTLETALNSNTGGGLPNMYTNTKGNLTIETSETIGNTSKGKINIESMDDIQFKPGDDIIWYSHHRAAGKQNEIAIKVLQSVLPSGASKEVDLPVKLQLNLANLTLSTKDKDLTKTGKTLNSQNQVTSPYDSQQSEDEILDVNITTGKTTGNKKGYLKVRARAIDLRCEEHGGIALQPKGKDANSQENKIKFEHGGGDGLEFGTFNTEKTSLFTDEYRFNRDGVVKMATREKVARAADGTDSKYDSSDSTTHYTYAKQSDDFYDKIAATDEQTTWHDIIKTSYALNNKVVDDQTGETIKAVETSITSKGNLEIATKSYYKNGQEITPNINIESAGKIKLSGTLDFGNSFNFGETKNGIKAQQNIAANGTLTSSDQLQIEVKNKGTESQTWNAPDSESICLSEANIAAGESSIVAKVSMYDIIKFVHWAKNNNFGPWQEATAE